MRIPVILLLVSACVSFAQPTIHVFEVDNIAQTGRVVTMGMVFRQGDIANCAVPVMGGTPLDASSYQCDVKTRWPDGSLQRAVVSFLTNLAALDDLSVAFQSGACNNSGSLTQAQMVHFNSDGWGARMVVTANGVTKTVDAVAMLNALADRTYCQIEYDLQGPIVTKVRVQDCTSAFGYDFGGRFGAPIATANVAGGQNGGSGCTSGNTVTFPGSLGTGAKVTANVSGGVIVSYTVSAGGLGFVPDRAYASDVAQGTCAAKPIMAYTVGPNVMNMNSGEWYTKGNRYASLHPVFDLMFVPSSNSVQVEFDLQNEWTSRGQDQKLDSLLFQTGAPAATVWDSTTRYPAGYVMPFRTNIYKTFWSGATPGHIRIDWNFPYLISTGMLQSYDLSLPVTSQVAGGAASGPFGISYNAFVSQGDYGDVGGTAGLTQDFADNSEGAPEQIEPLRYLYLMSSANSPAAARAWDVLTGEADTQNGLVSVPGGAGLWNVYMNIPYHWRESRPPNAEPSYTAGPYFCPNWAAITAKSGDACTTGSDPYLGRGFSRDAWVNDRISTGGPAGWPGGQYGGTDVGVSSQAGWAAGTAPGDCSHWQDYSFLPALLLGRRHYADELTAEADICISGGDPGPSSNNWFNDAGVGSNSIRNFGWSLNMAARAAVIAPDGSPEKHYYTSKVNSNLALLEGYLGLTGNALEAGISPNTTCAGFNARSANRWDTGRCLNAAGVTPSLHLMAHGQCPVGGDCTTYITANTVGFVEPFFQYFGTMSLNWLNSAGFTNALPSFQEVAMFTIEQTQDPEYNPYLMGVECMGVSFSAGACSATTPLFTSWSRVKNASTLNPVALGDCADHNYGLLARSVGAMAMGVSRGSYTGAAAYAWLTRAMSGFYFSRACTSAYRDQQLKFAIVPSEGSRPPVDPKRPAPIKR